MVPLLRKCSRYFQRLWWLSESRGCKGVRSCCFMTREHIASHLLTDLWCLNYIPLSKSLSCSYSAPEHTSMGFWHMSYWFNSLKSTDNWRSWCKQLFLKSRWNQSCTKSYGLSKIKKCREGTCFCVSILDWIEMWALLLKCGGRWTLSIYICMDKLVTTRSITHV